jgi:diacylglycerol kinase
MIRQRLLSFRYAFQGLRDMFRDQPNARIHLAALALAIAMGMAFKVSLGEWIALALTISIVLAAEAFNTALEHLTNLVSPGYHPLAGKAKDAAAAGVLFAALGALATGLIIFLPKLWLLFANV